MTYSVKISQMGEKANGTHTDIHHGDITRLLSFLKEGEWTKNKIEMSDVCATLKATHNPRVEEMYNNS
jgi:hypothetical protein